eukprot:94300-Amphidinium_carterae.1
MTPALLVPEVETLAAGTVLAEHLMLPLLDDILGGVDDVDANLEVDVEVDVAVVLLGFADCHVELDTELLLVLEAVPKVDVKLDAELLLVLVGEVVVWLVVALEVDVELDTELLLALIGEVVVLAWGCAGSRCRAERQAAAGARRRGHPLA